MNYSFTLQVHNSSKVLPTPTPDELQWGLDCLKTVQAGQSQYADSLGWHTVSEWAGPERLAQYRQLADHIRRDGDALVVIGIGGSNQAARAVIDALGETPGSPSIIWAGNSISAHSIRSVLAQLEHKKSIYVNVIAKNFETLEPGIGFRALRGFLRERYGDGWEKRVIATGTEDAQLEELARRHGFHFLPFPKNIGGRFTALSPVGLFPMAVAGLDITSLALGASTMEAQLKGDLSVTNPALVYAMARRCLYDLGYRMEMLSFFEPRWFRFSKWWTQLFGESEGKDKKGLYPITGSYSEDLHSIGQFVQDGTPCLFETFLNVREQDSSFVLQADEIEDGFSYLDGMDFHTINKAAFQATVEAHSQVLPCIEMNVASLDEYTFGQLFYFFQFACYLSGLLLGVNPFDQPGVEAYKIRMFEKLGK